MNTSLEWSRFTDLIRETFHGARRDNAAMKDSLCSHPEVFEGEGFYGFRCWQRCRETGLYRRIESVKRKDGYWYGDRETTLGPWDEREERVAA